MASKQPSSSESNKAARIAPLSTRHHHKNLSLLLSRSPWNAHFSEKESGRAVGESGQIPEQSAGEREGPLLSSPLSPWLAWFGPQMRPFSCRRHHSIYSACICLLLRRPSLSFACPLSPLPVPRSMSPRASTASSLQHPFLPLFPPSLGPSLPSLPGFSGWSLGAAMKIRIKQPLRSTERPPPRRADGSARQTESRRGYTRTTFEATCNFKRRARITLSRNCLGKWHGGEGGRAGRG